MTVFPPRRLGRRAVLGLPALAAAAVTVAAKPSAAAAAPTAAPRAAKVECVADLITAEPSLARGA
ncbi:hypothetical protein O7635_32455 [Asanoa sp. WMMD1127]|uniref:hypothetical protein n=1 Tax=Asanoa sp. WMMD1127 TaxID=3016107 RepID=UPI002417367D|nr:hypothetical protein [Asanoa sp. WMMD1127]MDG4826587.1 hypothetical protein [Asanoa sp. WMMD1127]